MYGLRQSGIQWYIRLVSLLNDIGFKALPHDPCVFIAQKGEQMMLIGIYDDDMILATNDRGYKEIIREYI